MAPYIQNFDPPAPVQRVLKDLLNEVLVGIGEVLPSRHGVWMVGRDQIALEGFLSGKPSRRVAVAGPECAKYRLEKGDVLFNHIHAARWIGKSAVFHGHRDPVVFDHHLLRLRPNPALLRPAYLSAWLNAQRAAGKFNEIYIREGSEGEVGTERLLSMTIELPSLAAQDEVLASIRVFQKGLKDGLRAVEQGWRMAREVNEKTLWPFFSGPRAPCWPRWFFGKKVKLILGRATTDWGGGEVRVVTPACFGPDGVLLPGARKAWMKVDFIEQCLVQKGDILLLRRASPDLLGRVALYDGQPPLLAVNDLAFRIGPAKGIEGPYVAAYLAFLYHSGFWKEWARKKGEPNPAITPKWFLKLQIPVPILSEQKRIGEIFIRGASLAGRLRHTSLELQEALGPFAPRFFATHFPVCPIPLCPEKTTPLTKTALAQSL